MSKDYLAGHIGRFCVRVIEPNVLWYRETKVRGHLAHWLASLLCPFTFIRAVLYVERSTVQLDLHA